MAQSHWIGYTDEGDYRLAAGNMEEVVLAAHAVRDGKFDDSGGGVVDTEEIFDCVIVGGGFSGLSAALFFSRQAGGDATSLVLDNAAVFGGVAKRNELVVDSHRLYAAQASVHFQPPYPHSFLKGVYDAMGLDFNAFKDYQTWRGPSPEIALTRTKRASQIPALPEIPKNFRITELAHLEFRESDEYSQFLSAWLRRQWRYCGTGVN